MAKGKKGGDLDALKSVDPEPNAQGASAAAKASDGASVDSASSAKASAEADKPATNADSKKDADSKEADDNSEKGDAASRDEKPRSAEAKGPVDSGDDSAPPPPPRPRPERPSLERQVSAFSSNLTELRSAFPDAEEPVRRAVLVAASNDLEAAFHGMLALTDATIRPQRYVAEQIEGDEALARRLATHEQRRHPRPPPRRRSYEQRGARFSGNYPSGADYGARDPEDESPGDEIYEGFQRGLNDTKQVVGSFWTSLKQRISNEVYDEDDRLYSDAPRRRESQDSRGSRGDQFRSQRFSQAQRAPQQADSSLPQLPPRKPSRTPTGSSAGTPAEPRSVNAFGDNVRPDEPEPDAFFIGESDDDLDDLDEPRNTPKDSERSVSAAAREAAEKAESAAGVDVGRAEGDAEPTTDNLKDASKDAEDAKDAKDATEDTAKDTDSKKDAETKETAKDLLNRVRAEAAEKNKK